MAGLANASRAARLVGQLLQLMRSEVQADGGQGLLVEVCLPLASMPVQRIA